MSLYAQNDSVGYSASTLNADMAIYSGHNSQKWILEPVLPPALLGWDLVDSGKHLDWDGNTTYRAYIPFAADVWNAYKPGVIRSLMPSVVLDVFFEDYYEDSRVAGRTGNNGKIQLNTFWFEQMEPVKCKHVVIHEFGHALGLNHTDFELDIMKDYARPIITLSARDMLSYDAAYANYN